MHIIMSPSNPPGVLGLTVLAVTVYFSAKALWNLVPRRVNRTVKVRVR